MSFESEEGFSLDLEPKKVFVNFLILTLKRCEFNIYFDGSATEAIRPLRGLIDSLDKESQDKLKQYRDQLQDYEHNLSLCTRESMETIYQEIMAFLHTTYLREVHFARPKYPGEKLGVPGE